MAARAAVLGAGLQGSCIALELAGRGLQVDLFDKSTEPMTQASLQNEGKIHLGYVYANDASLRTARMMAAGAMSFAPVLRRLLGPDFDRVPISTPFYYAVHSRSLLDAERIERHLMQVHRLYVDAESGAQGDYFGLDRIEPPRRLPRGELAGMFDEGTVLCAFRTAEVAIDPHALAALVRTVLAAQTNIRMIMHTTVTAVAPKDRAAEVEYQDAAGHRVELYDQVINALWESRLAIDATAGLKPQRPWLHRVKFFVRLQAPAQVEALPSVTTVLGPFGDIVNYGNGEFYLSWYPAGMVGMSTDIQPPDWLAAAQALAPQLKFDIATALAAIVPPVARISDADLARAELRGGYIFAWGESDIDDSNSGLHERYAVGPHSVGHYHSVDTGKLTMAPLFAQQVADRVCPSQG